jgi:hypothetical protein
MIYIMFIYMSVPNNFWINTQNFMKLGMNALLLRTLQHNTFWFSVMFNTDMVTSWQLVDEPKSAYGGIFQM